MLKREARRGGRPHVAKRQADHACGTGGEPPESILRIDARMHIGQSDGMVNITGGTFRMGSDKHYPEERPAHIVTVDGFWMDRYAVTNAGFAAFVAATGYVTFAERPLDPALYPGVPKTATAYSIWPATSGNGPRTGIALATRTVPTSHAARRAIHAVSTKLRVTILHSLDRALREE
jgi:formylglycine-generating enzyme required for sulfatase activity